ncbi:MAG TPA: hypothetical protein VLI54_05485 [Bacillota bacterium]|nr:hypothetical protein [Bacillota bacterium]
MNRRVEIAQPELWVSQEVPGSIQLYQPYVVPSLPGINLRRPMGTYREVDGERLPNISPELRNDPSVSGGFDFFDMARDMGMTSADLTINLVLTKGETAADLGPAGPDAPYERLVRESAMSVYGLSGSIVAQEAADLAAAARGWRNQSTLYERVKDAAPDPTRLWSCDPMENDGIPVGPAEERLVKMADHVVRLGDDVTDKQGLARKMADCVYLDQLQMYQAGRVGVACQVAWERANYGPIGDLTVTLSAEMLAIYHKFDALGVYVELNYATPDIEPDNNDRINALGVTVHEGVLYDEFLPKL